VFIGLHFYVSIVPHCVECAFCVSQFSSCYKTLINVQETFKNGCADWYQLVLLE